MGQTDIFKHLRVSKKKRPVKEFIKNCMFPPSRTFGNYLRKCRVLANLPITKVGKMMGYSSGQYISNWEREISVPPVKALKKLASIYRISESDLNVELIKFKVRKVERNHAL